MDTQNLKVIVVFSPESGNIKTLAETIARKYEECCSLVVLKTAAEVSIPEIIAADVIVFGAEEDGETLFEGGYKEIARAFNGINLAGKTGAIFSYSMMSAVKGIKEIIKDTNLHITASDLLFIQNGKSLKTKKIDKWIRKTCISKA